MIWLSYSSVSKLTLPFQAAPLLCVRTLRRSMLIMIRLHLILHPAQPAALTAVAMETSGAERRRDAGWVAKRGEEQEIEKRRVVMKEHEDWGVGGGIIRVRRRRRRGSRRKWGTNEREGGWGWDTKGGGGWEASGRREATERRVFFSDAPAVFVFLTCVNALCSQWSWRCVSRYFLRSSSQ